MSAYQIGNRLGSRYEAFCFSGPVPSTIAEIPFNMFVDTIDPWGPTGRQKQIDSVSIYNNMVCHLIANAEGNSNSVGYDTCEWTQNSEVEAGLTKASFQDIKNNTYRHIPQTIASDLVKYDLNSHTNKTSNTINLSGIFWYTGNTRPLKLNIPEEDKDAGFFIEGDFGYEAGITSVNCISNGTNFFSGDLSVSRWDPTLLEGAGDWVLVKTVTSVESQINNTILLDSEIVTSKIRVDFASAGTVNTFTNIITLEFLGSAPVSELPEVNPVTWALLLPSNPDSGMYNDHVDEPPFMLVTAGGPSDDVELKINKKTPDRGRVSTLLSLSVEFLAEEY
jgi:hypothetical protein